MGELGYATLVVETERDTRAPLERPVFHVPEYLVQQAAVVIAGAFGKRIPCPSHLSQTRTTPSVSE